MRKNKEKLFELFQKYFTVDIVLLNKVNTAYPLHTHAEYYTMGSVVDGKIIIESKVIEKIRNVVVTQI